jgi:threo-3-hydroxy-L-aspartate ammonia-lyase
MLTPSSLSAARERVYRIARVTPLLDASQAAGRPLHLKCENFQVAGAFKIRGATNMLAQLDPAERDRGVITYSSGNHGQAVAYAARAFGAPAVVVMPTTAPRVKVDGAKAFGAEVLFAGTTSADRRVRAEEEAARRGLTIVPPFDHEWIIAGQATVGLEILEQRPDVAVVVVPVGGGGLASGVASAIKQSHRHVRIIGVEPAGAPSMKTSIEAGAPATLARSSSIADGLLTLRPGDLTFACLRELADAIVTVEDGEIVEAMRWAFTKMKIVVEPSGAAAAAAVMTGQVDAALGRVDGPVVAIVSGGNVGLETLTELLAPGRC